MKWIQLLILSGFFLGISFSVQADMPLPFPEESSNSFQEPDVAPENETGFQKTQTEESKALPSEKKDSAASGGGADSKTSNVSTSSPGNGNNEIASKDSSTEESTGIPEKTTLPNSSKTSLKKKKDKKKEDPSESGYKKGVLRLRENQRNNAKTEFNQASGQGKTANASKLEDARLTAESANDASSITEQIDSEEEKWKAVFEVARALRGNGKIPEAESQYLKIITEAPENFQSISLLSLGEMLSSTDRKDSSRRYLLQLVRLLQKKPELDPQKQNLEKAVTLIARIYGDQGRYEEAENWAKTYLTRMNPDASEDSPFVKELRRILKRRYY
ncbi:hypothetical protein [Leptospira adleri]|uniref:Tetratricopeptide repeat protein n=1 Tax=Leptospira adleri TaxID=2023186 RepID=A0A2M9YLZ4_9LEPT|nr:hypothetical protein [Leptospira adleri]PJZ52571.1 hypothetical protein CH380_14000 [Leptospira adleri]PJZ60966.1 hypothetical protein CH376_15755 [Leptospira adleri]